MEKAVDVAKAEIDRRLADMNEFRKQLTDQAETFVLKELYDREHDALIKRIDIIREIQVTKADGTFAIETKRTIDGHIMNQEGKEAANIKFTWGFALIGPAVGALIAWLLMHR
jgi:hypothetical protein